MAQRGRKSKKFLKIVAQRGTKSKKILLWMGLRRFFLASLGDVVGYFCEAGRKMRELGAKMAASWAPDDPYWRLDGHLGVILKVLGAS